MRVPYGLNKEFFKYSMFPFFCNQLTNSAVSACALLASKKVLDPVAPVYKYCLISVTNILTTTCQYEALKYVSFPVQTLAKCAKMIPVMVWGTLIMQKKYKGFDYLRAFLVTLGCSVFTQFLAIVKEYHNYHERQGLMVLHALSKTNSLKGYNMEEIHNQIFYTTLCSCVLSFTGLILQGHLLFCISQLRLFSVDIALLSTLLRGILLLGGFVKREKTHTLWNNGWFSQRRKLWRCCMFIDL